MTRTIITGRLTRDPEMRTVASDLKITTFSVAVERPYSKEKKVDFYDCKAFRRTAEIIQENFAKGRKILIEGHMESNKWTDKNGATRVSWELVVENFEFCDSKRQAEAAPATDANPFDGTDKSAPVDVSADDFADIDDMPF